MVMHVSHLILKISFLTLFGCAVKIKLDINPVYFYMPCPVLMTPETCDNHIQRDKQINRLKRTYKLENKIGDIF